MEAKVVSLPPELARMREADRLIHFWCKVEAEECNLEYLRQMRFLTASLREFSLKFYPDLH